MQNQAKVELHCHLDGSVRPQTVWELIEAYALENPFHTLSELEAHMKVPHDCRSLAEYLERFEWPNRVMQTQEALERITFEVYEDACRDGVKYLEIRFAPFLHTQEGLSLDQVIDAVVAGLERAKKSFAIKGNVILSFMRHHPPADMVLMCEAGKPFLGKGVVAVDLCAGESAHFCERFVEPVAHARQLGYQVTIHAGETGIAQNVIDAITLLKAKRIGHGVAIQNHQEAFDLVKRTKTHIESCPTSNMQTKAITSWQDHPIQTFSNEGLEVSINTDNRTVSDITLTHEYEMVQSLCQWSDQVWEKRYLQAIEASFADAPTKAWLHAFIKD